MRTATVQFSESSGSLNDLDLFTGLSFLQKSLPNTSFTECPPFFFTEKCVVASPFPKNWLLKGSGRPVYYEARNDYTDDWKTTLCVTDVVAIGGKLVPREFLCVTGIHRKHLIEAPELHKTIAARKPCVTDVLCKVGN